MSETIQLPRLEQGLTWVCSQCCKDGLTPRPQGNVTDGLCGPHMDLMRIELWQWKARRAA